MAPLLELTRVCRTYGSGDAKVFALRDVDLAISQGEFVSIMGPSGSGKSTLMNILGMLDRATSGDYLVDGEDVGSLSEPILAKYRNRRFGFVFQGSNLLPRTTAIENVTLPLIYRGLARAERRRKAIEALTALGLGHRLKHRPQQLSGGEQQRIAIARAIVAEPSVLLADEPTGALDSETGNKILIALRGLNQRGMTIILVTHDESVASYASRLISMKNGRVVGESTAAGKVNFGVR